MNVPAGLILAGGKSRRFGSDKARYTLDGSMLIQRVYGVLSSTCHPVYVSIGHKRVHYPIAAPHLEDPIPDAGPLAGIQAGLSATQSEWLIVLAVDLPHISPVHLSHLLDLRTGTLDAILATGTTRTQPLCGCYHTRILPQLSAYLDLGHRAVMPFVQSLKTSFAQLPDDALLNLNEPPG